MKKLSIALAVVGLLAATLLIGWFGADHVIRALLSVGWDGFGLILLWQGVLFVILGLAWTVIAAPSAGVRSWVFLWGRMVRDSAGNVLPFSPVGGFVFGARSVTLHGVRWPVAAATTVVDITVELLAQLAFAGIALCILVSKFPETTLAVPLAVGLGIALAAIGCFVWLQQGAAPIFSRLGRRIASQWFDDAGGRVSALQAELSAIYGRPGRLVLSALLHMLGWLGTGFGDWIMFNLLGVDIELSSAIALDGLLHAVLALAFMVPGYAGVQEATYAGLGMVFGLPPDMALGVSLLRRARDLAVGVPVLIVWQMFEVRRLRASPNI